MTFTLTSSYQPSGDQPQAIKELLAGLRAGEKFQTLLGVTGSGKTFTIANVIQEIQKPTLVIAPNKTLAAQLCNEFREFFPNNAVEYFVSYYDYYQPEAYLPRTDVYIEKEAMINQEIDRLRHAATQSLLTREDVIVVASVSCIYGLGSPKEYKKSVLKIEVGDAELTRHGLLRRLVDMQFERTNSDLTRGSFRARGEVVEIMPTNEEKIFRLIFENETVSRIELLHHVTRKLLEKINEAWIFPAKHYVVSPESLKSALSSIRFELDERLVELETQGKVLEAERLSRRTRYDLEMIQEVGYCNGIENYSRHFEGRPPGEPPSTLLDFFPKDFLLMIDESHVAVPQIGGMFAGDQARKTNLVEHGFRLPSAKDNRPLKFDEFEKKLGQVIFTSATPGNYEHDHSTKIVEQIIRPTGLVDPEVEIRPISASEKKKGNLTQVEDLIQEIIIRAEKKERTLVTTLTKKMAEDLSEFLIEKGIKTQYLHSDVDTLDRITTLTDLRKGKYDVLVGVNLLREGLDLPEVTLVAILDADKEGFLRSETSLIQTIGRAARNIDGKVILYADEVTGSLKRALKETNRRRVIQLAYNEKHGITPKTIQKKIGDIRAMFGEQEQEIKDILKLELTAEPHEIKQVIVEKEKEMRDAAFSLDFETAAIIRDQIVLLKRELKEKTEKKRK
ncbi:MAG: UvrABC system protein B [Candidatus Uhrbacteria bacterium GW2011_GWE2_45_35]|uniref:UvrABC system protein B n=2 Tax=Candidatus Uhriibacteriota TaxID=1752732 RepID=A0A0G1LJ61_9BACT|nr:MAG: UvrABC system protein B [Candidatus Uhrbacteria bacterium GW2011_GWF2_44_350]KKU08988.1 MAG: UvrABC system protein B [Candidatus Uhrbacteria bacterium GW2011_GWE2_45_35]HCU31266.1 excinuclease ABC subunit B [Candidatus Uhrbacteria bacterium]